MHIWLISPTFSELLFETEKREGKKKPNNAIQHQ